MIAINIGLLPTDRGETTTHLINWLIDEANSIMANQHAISIVVSNYLTILIVFELGLSPANNYHNDLLIQYNSQSFNCDINPHYDY